jgi:aminoglycoside 6'-N-acetyltransferase
MSRVTILRGERVALRPATPDDVPALVRVLETPEVARWWDATDAGERMRAEMAGGDVTTFVVEAGGACAGLIQCRSR